MDDDYSDDEMMGFYEDPMEELVDEFDDVEFVDDEEDQDADDLDDRDQEDNASDYDNLDEHVEKYSVTRKLDVNTPKVEYCHICGAEVIIDELPDSISRDAFEQFGLCLNCQWGFFMENGGHF